MQVTDNLDPKSDPELAKLLSHVEGCVEAVECARKAVRGVRDEVRILILQVTLHSLQLGKSLDPKTC